MAHAEGGGDLSVVAIEIGLLSPILLELLGNMGRPHWSSRARIERRRQTPAQNSAVLLFVYSF